MVTAYLIAAAVLVASLAMIRFRRPSVAVPVLAMVLAAIAWLVLRSLRDPGNEPSTVLALNIAAVQLCAALFYLTCRRLVDGRWRVPPAAWFVAAVMLVGCTVAMWPPVGITEARDYTRSPIYIVHLAYCFGLLVAAVVLLNRRQHDPSRHVREFVRGAQASAIALLTLQVTLPTVAPFATVPIGLFSVWATRQVREWSRTASRADRLLDSLGVFIFVVDGHGRLLEWNGPAASLMTMKGTPAERGLDIAAELELTRPFVDGTTVVLPMEHGILRTTMSVHRVDPLAREHEVVLMLRPVQTTFERSSFPAVSGNLEGYDPSTQTLNRRAALDLVRSAGASGQRIVRIDVTGDPARADDVMFLVARRIDARATSMGWTGLRWARLDTWVLITRVEDEMRVDSLPFSSRLDDLGVTLSVSIHDPRPDESTEAFVTRVTRAHLPSDRVNDGS